MLKANATTDEAFFRAYVDCTLWASIDDAGDPLEGYNVAPEALETMRQDHDFWLTRNKHGAGFWDGDWAPEVGKRLTDAAHAYGSCDLYVGDDGMVHCG